MRIGASGWLTSCAKAGRVAHDSSAGRARIAVLIEAILLDVCEPFRHLDIRAPGIFDERDRDAKLRHLGVGTVQFDALSFELLCELLEVFDLEADMIDRSAG